MLTKLTVRRFKRFGNMEIDLGDPTLDKDSPWGPDLKVSDDFLTPVFRRYYRKLGLPTLVAKTNFHVLVEHVAKPDISPEVGRKLDAIAQVAGEAQP